MPRIAGVNIPEKKQIETSLSYIHGIGRPLARKILNEIKINPAARASEIDAADLNKLKDYIEKNFKVEGELRREKMMAIKRLKDIGCWRGIRHIKGLPVRGQRTKTNSRTVRGNKRVTMGSGKSKAGLQKT